MADTITEIYQRSRGTYGRKRVRAALKILTDSASNLGTKRNVQTQVRDPNPCRRLQRHDPQHLGLKRIARLQSAERFQNLMKCHRHEQACDGYPWGQWCVERECGRC